MAYDSARDRLVLFDGHEPATWEYDGTRWMKVTVEGPPWRIVTAMSYDSARARTVLFGGWYSVGTTDDETASFWSPARTDTWEWDGERWTLVDFQGPPDMAWPAMSYDSHRGVNVLHSGGGQRDTWEWDGVLWRRAATGGPGLLFANMTYDEAHARSVMVGFSGYPMGAFGPFTFLWDGTEWTSPALSPHLGYWPAMSYDGARGRVVLAEGLGKTWEWDGSAWELRDAPGPSVYEAMALAFDTARGRSVLYGGNERSGPPNLIMPLINPSADMWAWDGETWAEVPFEGLSERPGARLFYDEALGRTTLFGGADISGHQPGDTWAWDGDAWSAVADAGPPPRLDCAASYDATRKVGLVFGGWAGDRDLGDTWAWDGTTWTLASAAGPPPRSRSAVTYDRARSRIVLHGGVNTIMPQADGGVPRPEWPVVPPRVTFLDDTWVWDGTAWESLGVAGPPPRSGHALVYDEARDVVVLFGGYAEDPGAADGGVVGRYLSDTWELGTAGWVRRPVWGPGPRESHTMVYDHLRRRTVLFGGCRPDGDSCKALGDVWEWDGNVWLQVQAEGPGPRRCHSMAWDRQRGRAVLFGGSTEHGATTSDTWELYGVAEPCWRGAPEGTPCACEGGIPGACRRGVCGCADRDAGVDGGTDGPTAPTPSPGCGCEAATTVTPARLGPGLLALTVTLSRRVRRPTARGARR
ncbi:MAG: hypothetical protein HY906_15230 [Deltaproteobacteria bacterium]|nr:hypothetical protein [Deltaproteobacteria bacterium]